MLPRAADLYRKQLAQGLDGDPRAASKARVLLRELLGPITLTTDAEGQVFAAFSKNPNALIAKCGAHAD